MALQNALSPTYCQLIDDSQAHAGHPGAQSGKMHIKLTIASEQLDNLDMITQHRLIYEALGQMMHDDIHALSIQIRPTEQIQ